MARERDTSRSVWTPNLDGDTEYPTIEEYATRVREQFVADPLQALRVLPNAETTVEVTHG